MFFPLLTLALAAEGPHVERGAQQWVLSNRQVRCVLDLQRGGLPALVTDSQGRVYARDLMLYTDHGLFPDAGMLSSSQCAAPKMSVREKEGAVAVTAEGILAPVAGKKLKEPLSYRVTCALGAGPELSLRLEVATPADRPEARGFLALLMPVPGAREWYARTLNGLAAEEFGAARDRVWQSADEGLDPDRPELGVCWPDGRRLAIEGLKAEGPLQNVFWHQSAPGEAHLFLALLGDGPPRAWKAGERWIADCRLQIAD